MFAFLFTQPQQIFHFSFSCQNCEEEPSILASRSWQSCLSPLLGLRELSEEGRLTDWLPVKLTEPQGDCCLFGMMLIYLVLSVALSEASWEDTRHNRLYSFGMSSPLGDIAKAKEKSTSQWANLKENG